MTVQDVIGACGPVFAVFCDVTRVAWDQYAAALEGVNPADLDDALSEIRRTHGFRNAPLPADVRGKCDAIRRARQQAEAAKPVPVPVVAPTDGRRQSVYVPALGREIALQVLPDDHPVLRRVACQRCRDTGYVEGERRHEMGQVYDTVTRCACWQANPVLAEARARQAERRKGAA